MTPSIRFEAIRIGRPPAAEDAWLGLADDHVLVVLVPISGEDIPPESAGWFLQSGFDPCDQEGLFFPNLAMAESWMLYRLDQQPRDVEDRELP
jgi:hypothetical protein